MTRRAASRQTRAARPGRSRWVAPTELVPHPRFGVMPRFTDAAPREAARGLPRYRHTAATVIAGTAVLADLRRQARATMATPYYLDVLLTCRGCARPFIFYAVEQQHWYEELGFGLDAWTERCVPCGKVGQQRRARFHRYAEAIVQPSLDDAALAQLLDDAAALWREGRLKKRATLERLLGRARRQVPAHPATAALAALVRAPRPTGER
jgi:hypothetical protein